MGQELQKCMGKLQPQQCKHNSHLTNHSNICQLVCLRLPKLLLLVVPLLYCCCSRYDTIIWVNNFQHIWIGRIIWLRYIKNVRCCFYSWNIKTSHTCILTYINVIRALSCYWVDCYLYCHNDKYFKLYLRRLRRLHYFVN